LLEKPGQDARAQEFNLKRLKKKILRLASGYKTKGIWSEYTEICSYGDTSETAEKSLIEEFLASVRPKTVLDLGCNTGDYCCSA
jgi:ribosomal protein L11 methylase PrmA